MEIGSRTKLACLIGHPVVQSFSPYIHNFLATKYEEDLKYVCFDVAPDTVGEALGGIRNLGIIGSNVTIPHKIAVMDYLDEIDHNAKIIGAVNTIKNEQGKLVGYNTDGKGFVKSVLDVGHDIQGKCVMILGAGGASRAICIELASRGIGKLIIRNNTLSKAEAIAESVRQYFAKVIVEVAPLTIEASDLEEVDFLINTTPLGMTGKQEVSPINEAICPPTHLVVCDAVYTPQNTPLIKWAKSHELSVVYGIGMLINQAIESFSIWTEIQVDAYEEVLHILKARGVIQ